MRVLHLVPTMGGGGAERQLTYVVRAQVAAGWDVHVGLIAEGPLYGDLQAAGATIHRLRSAGNYDPRLVARVYSLIRKVRPDVVHTRILQMDVVGGIAATLRRVPWILSERCSSAPYGSGGKDRLRNFVARFASAVEANTRFGAEYWKTILPAIPRRVIPNAVPVEEMERVIRADPRAFDVEPGTAVVLFAGRFDEQKNVLRLIDALAPVLRDRSAVAILCGRGPLEDAAQRRAAERGIEQQVRFPGFVADLWPLMKAADVFVFPSMFEGQPNSVLEAAACRCPLVLSDIPEHRELFDDASALFADAASADSIAAALVRALDDPAASRQRAEAAHEAVSRYSIAHTSSLLESLYREVVAQ
jgi:glycosyltransferase involved in cell wall biosynthesis